jgi:hypothetical protein
MVFTDKTLYVMTTTKKGERGGQASVGSSSMRGQHREQQSPLASRGQRQTKLQQQLAASKLACH